MQLDEFATLSCSVSQMARNAGPVHFLPTSEMCRQHFRAAARSPLTPWPDSFMQLSWTQVVKIFCVRCQQLDQAGKQELLLSMAR